MNATEQKVAEKLKNLKQTGKNVKILTKELNNVSSPKLRSDILDFILFCEHEKPATWRISSFLDSLDEIANKTALIDGAFMDKFLNLYSGVSKDNQPRARASMLSLLSRFIKDTHKYTPTELVDRAVGVAISLYENEFFSPSVESDLLRETLPKLIEALLTMEKKDRKRHFRALVDSLLGGFLNCSWGDMEPLDWEDIDLVMGGGLTATVVGINKLGVSPSMGFVSFPYIFPSLEPVDKMFLSPFMEKVNARLRAETAMSGEILGVSWFTNDYRVLTNSVREIASPGDLEGLVIRVPESKVMTDTFKAWGATAVPLSWAEVPEAARLGSIDGQENPYSIIVGAGLQETQKFLTPIKYNLWCGVVLVNASWYESLSPELRAAVDKAGIETSKWKMDKSKKESAQFIDLLKSAGVKFTEPAGDEKEWVEIGTRIWGELYDQSGGREWVDEVRSELEKH